MGISKGLMTLGLVLAAGLIVYQWNGDAIQKGNASRDSQPSGQAPVNNRGESGADVIELPQAPSVTAIKPANQPKQEIRSRGIESTPNPFIGGPAANTARTEPEYQQEEPLEATAEEDPGSGPGVRDLLKEVPDAYPITNAEAFYVPPGQRYPGNLGGPPPLKLPPMEASAPPPGNAMPNGATPAGFGAATTGEFPDLTPPALLN